MDQLGLNFDVLMTTYKGFDGLVINSGPETPSLWINGRDTP